VDWVEGLEGDGREGDVWHFVRNGEKLARKGYEGSVNVIVSADTIGNVIVD
jgi:hypothetical protein